MKYKIDKNISAYQITSMPSLRHKINGILNFFYMDSDEFSIYSNLTEKQIDDIAKQWPDVTDYLELQGYITKKSPDFKKGEIVKITNYTPTIWVEDGNLTTTILPDFYDTFEILEILYYSFFFGNTSKYNVMLRRQKDRITCFTNVKYLSY